jgi:hypothetical protein
MSHECCGCDGCDDCEGHDHQGKSCGHCHNS